MDTKKKKKNKTWPDDKSFDAYYEYKHHTINNILYTVDYKIHYTDNINYVTKAKYAHNIDNNNNDQQHIVLSYI